MTKKYFIVYQTTNKINGKIYIGQHQSNSLYDNYLGSGAILFKAIRKYGKENFERTNLFVFDNFEEMLSKEIELVTAEFCLREDTYNMAIGGAGGNMIWSQETRQKMSESSKGKLHTEETRRKMSESAKGRKTPLETRRKQSVAKLGKQHTEEARRKMAEAWVIRRKKQNHD